MASEGVKLWITRWGPEPHHGSMAFFHRPTRHESGGLIWWSDEEEDGDYSDAFAAPRRLRDLVQPGECRCYTLTECTEDEDG